MAAVGGWYDGRLATQGGRPHPPSLMSAVDVRSFLIRSYRDMGRRRSYRLRSGLQGALRGGAGCCGCCIRLLYSRIRAGVTGVERERLERLLVGSDEASVAALAALRCGGSYMVWDGATSAELLARVYGRRLRLTRRRGIETTNLERAVELLGRHQQPVRLGQIRTADGSWTFMLFLTDDGSKLTACTGVRRVQV